MISILLSVTSVAPFAKVYDRQDEARTGTQSTFVNTPTTDADRCYEIRGHLFYAHYSIASVRELDR